MAKRTLISLKCEYTFHDQIDCTVMISTIENCSKKETKVVMSNIKHRIYMENMTHFKKNLKDTNHHLSEWMEDISQAGDTYKEITCLHFNLYATTSCKEFS